MHSLPKSPCLQPLAAALALAGVLCAAAPATAMRTHAPAGKPLERRDAIVVANCDDSGPGSLREAYANAIDGDDIDLRQLACGTITLTAGALVDDASARYVRIIGPGPNPGRTLTISGHHADRVFVHNGGEALSLEGLVIEAGRHHNGNGGCVDSRGGVLARETRFVDCAVSGSAVHGGAIFASGDVRLVGSSISGSSASGTSGASGGAIHALGSVTLVQTTLQANIAIAASGQIRTGQGGGVYAASAATIVSSTLTGNHSAFGGGVHAYALSILDSTLSGNTAEGWGAGAMQTGTAPAVIANSTIAFNRNDAGAGAGLHLYGRANIDSTIITGNTVGFPGGPSDVAGQGFVVGAHNLIRTAQVPVPADTIMADPLLDPQLHDNGGWTPTHALRPGSPAIDAGSNRYDLCCDQRLQQPGAGFHFERVVGTAADIGAYEVGAGDRIFVDGFDPDS